VKETIIEGELTPKYMIEEDSTIVHDHSVDGVLPLRGLSAQQKTSIDECLALMSDR
jgi:hypothetical protein